jgi:hypothetical protein
LAPDDYELLAKEQILGDQHCPGREAGQDEVEQESNEGEHGAERLPRGRFLAPNGSGAALATLPSESDQIPLTYRIFAPHSDVVGALG